MVEDFTGTHVKPDWISLLTSSHVRENTNGRSEFPSLIQQLPLPVIFWLV